MTHTTRAASTPRRVNGIPVPELCWAIEDRLAVHHATTADGDAVFIGTVRDVCTMYDVHLHELRAEGLLSYIETGARAAR